LFCFLFCFAACSKEKTAELKAQKMALTGPPSLNFSVFTPFGTSPSSIALSSGNFLKIGARVEVESTVSEISTIVSMGQNQGRMVEPDAILGHIYSEHAVDIGDRVHVKGSIYAPSVIQGNNVVIDGAIDSDTPLTPLQEFKFNVEYPEGTGQRLWLEPGETATAEPGHFREFRVGPNSVVELESGAYYIDTLTFEDSSKLKIKDTSGPTVIYAKNITGFRCQIEAQGKGEPDLLLVYLSSNELHLDRDMNGTVLAPHAKLTLHSRTHKGAFFAKELRVEANAKIIHKPASSLLIISEMDLFDCIKQIPSKSDLDFQAQTLARQIDILRYCSAPGMDTCLTSLHAKAAIERKMLVVAFMEDEATVEQYLGLARDRQEKLYKAEDDPEYAQSLCNGQDADGDWVVDENDLCPDTPANSPTDDDGCPTPLPKGPDGALVKDLLENHKIHFSQICELNNLPGLVAPGGFFWPHDSSKGVYLVMTKDLWATPQCPLYYQWEIRGETKDGQPAHLLMDFHQSERTEDLVGLGRPVPAGMIQFNVFESDTGDKGKLATDMKPYKGLFRVRALNNLGAVGPWSAWKSSTQADCLSLGFRCANL
jgi:hypothetical protein